MYSRGAAPAVVDVTMDVLRGDSICLTGPSGSGKSTLLAILGGVVQPSEGSVRWWATGERPSRDTATDVHGCDASWVMQTANLLPRAHALENAALEAIIRGIPPSRALARSAAVLDELGLGAFYRTPARKLSGGQAQRVAVARSIVASAPLILADEPTGQLDSVSTARVVSALLATVPAGATVVMASHDPAVAERCSRVLTMVDGTIRDDR
ncbi:ABC transporter ATP-binding protein [Cellulomonas carbonis]|nr:ATP-binding cassette domain-containing protein [Cellulomonas carbonis]MDT0164187.1 ATP-binding cassette domain-containing protein [Actinotalea sp. AC32]